MHVPKEQPAEPLAPDPLGSVPLEVVPDSLPQAFGVAPHAAPAAAPRKTARPAGAALGGWTAVVAVIMSVGVLCVLAGLFVAYFFSWWLGTGDDLADRFASEAPRPSRAAPYTQPSGIRAIPPLAASPPQPYVPTAKQLGVGPKVDLAQIRPREPQVPDGLDPAVKERIDSALANLERPLPRKEFVKLCELQAHDGPIKGAAISAAGPYAITCGQDGACRAWDLVNGKQLGQLETPIAGDSVQLAIHPTGEFGLVGGEFGKIHKWDLQTGKITSSIDVPQGSVVHLAVDNHPRSIVAATNTGALLLVPLQGGSTHSLQLAPELVPIEEAALNPAGSLLFARSGQKLIKVPIHKQRFQEPITTSLATVGVRLFDATHLHMVMKHPLEGMVLFDSAWEAGQQLNGTTTSSTLRDIRAMGFSSNSHWHLAVDSSGRMEIRRTQKFELAAQAYDVAVPNVTMAVVSRRLMGFTVLFCLQDGLITAWRLESAPLNHEETLFFLHELLINYDDFTALEYLAARLRSRPSFCPWDARFSLYDKMLDDTARISYRFSDGDEVLANWLAKFPNSETVRLAVAQQHIWRGWEARGTGWANTVSRDAWQVFHENIEQAWQIIQPIADAPDPPAEVFPIVFEIAKTQSWEREEIDPYVQRLMEIHPSYASAHIAMAITLMPRWGGEDDREPEAYARRISDRIGGKEGDAVYSQIACELRRYHDPNAFMALLGFDMQRVHRGLAYLAEIAPDDRRAINNGLLFAYIQQDGALARQYLEKFKPLEDSWLPEIWRDQRQFFLVVDWARLAN
jgi:hypothetical protein